MTANYYEMFKAYDIRGTYPELNYEVFYWSGYALITEVLRKEGLSEKICVMRDHRYTSPEFYKAFYNGILDAGGEVVVLEVGPSDLLYAACQLFDLPGAIVTASHNPKDDNGIKIVKHIPQMLGLSDGLDKIRDFVLPKLENQEKPSPDNFKTLEEDTEKKQQVLYFYQNTIKKIGELEVVDSALEKRNQKLKLAVDAGNGMGGYVMDILSKMYENIEFIPLYWELDGTYPNHPADPQNFDNLKDLQKTILDQGCDFGFAFDGDADRVFFVDEKGEVVQGDFLVAVFAKEMLHDYFKSGDSKNNPAVVSAQPGSLCVPLEVYKNNGIAVPSKQGHTAIKNNMEEFKAIYGGEFSGHHYFGDFSYMDSGVLAAVLMIKTTVIKNCSLSSIFAHLRKQYFISNLMNIKIPEGVNFEIIKERIEKGFPEATISYFDGISVFYDDWKFSARPSNTEPVMRFILETHFEDKVQEKIEEVKKVLAFDF